LPAFTDLPSREKEAKLRELAQQTLGIRIFNKAQQLQSACNPPASARAPRLGFARHSSWSHPKHV
jgi:hypothetical protein